MQDGSAKEPRHAPDVTLKHDSFSELDILTQELKHLLITDAPLDAKSAVLEQILLKSSCSINEKYAIIDVSGLFERNKVRMRGLETTFRVEEPGHYGQGSGTPTLRGKRGSCPLCPLP